MGRLVREKGIVELLEAMSMVSEDLPNLVLLVAGDTKAAGDRDQDTAQWVHRLIDRGDLGFRVVCTGFLEDIESMLQAVDVFTLPSYREGMPRSIIEAMACGKPVVATNIRGCREEVIPGETGLLVPVGDPEALARALVQLLSQLDLARELGARGRRRALAQFDEQDVLDRQVAAYQHLVRQRLRRPVPVVAYAIRVPSADLAKPISVCTNEKRRACMYNS